MNVFNSFPIIWEMTRGGPGYETSTTTVFMYDLKGTFVGQAAAMSIVNFTLVVVIVLVFLRLNGGPVRRQPDMAVRTPASRKPGTRKQAAHTAGQPPAPTAGSLRCGRRSSRPPPTSSPSSSCCLTSRC